MVSRRFGLTVIHNVKWNETLRSRRLHSLGVIGLFMPSTPYMLKYHLGSSI